VTSRQRAAAPLTFSNADAERKLLEYDLERTAARAELLAEVIALDFELFGVPLHSVLLAMQQVAAAGEPLVATVSDALRETDSKLAASIQLLDLVEQAGPIPGPYRRMLESCRRRHALHSAGTCLTERAGDPSRDPREVVERLRQQLERLEAFEAAR
jgi:hypothetical protein